MNTLAIIPARAGSKRLFGKNMREMCKHPLVYWTIIIAKRIKDATVVVSSDDKRVLKLAKELGVLTSERPPELATEDAYIWDAVRFHLLNSYLWIGNEKTYKWYDTIILLQPTSPLRILGDVERCIDVYHANGNTITLTANCNYMFRPNGICYVVKSSDLFETREPVYHNAVFTPPERSIDINTIEEFEEAERRMYERNIV